LWCCIEGNVRQGAGRSLAETVAFDHAKVTGIDWLSYRVRRHRGHEVVDIVSINTPEPPPTAAAKALPVRSPRRWPIPSWTRRACSSAASR
jgi:hypothetical protein